MSENDNLQPQPQSQTFNESQPVQAAPAFCKYCGSPIQPESAFCASCGRPLKAIPQQQTAGAMPQQQWGSVPQQPMPNYGQPMQQQGYVAAAYQQPAPQPIMSSNTQNTTSLNNSTTVVVHGEGSNGLGTAGFVFAVLAFFVCWVPVLDIIIWGLGLLFSFIGLFKAPRGLAIAGFILSIIGIIVLLTFFGALLHFAGK